MTVIFLRKEQWRKAVEASLKVLTYWKVVAAAVGPALRSAAAVGSAASPVEETATDVHRCIS